MFQIFLSEMVGTLLLLLLGVGVVANVVLPKTKGHNGGWLLINIGWGFAVLIGVYAAFRSGGHINPAVTIGLLVSGAKEFAPGVPADLLTAAVYIAGQFSGAFIGAILAWAAYKRHFDEDADPALKLAAFSTGPAIRSKGWNLVTEVLATFALVYGVISFAHTPSGLGPLPVAALMITIGAGLGGPTGYAINPARDLAPRIAHAVLPIRGKGGSDWGYSWVPVVGPLTGGILAGLTSSMLM